MAESESESKAETASESKAESQGESKAKTETKSKSSSKAKAQAKSKAKAQAKSQAQAQAKSQAQLTAKALEEAKKASIKVAEKASMKLESKMKNQDKFYIKEIEGLKSKMSNLMKLNQKLGDNLIKEQKFKKKEVKEEVASFIQNYDGKVNGLKKTFNMSREEIKNNFLQNQEIVKEAVSTSEHNYSQISTTISELYSKINEISKKQEEQMSSGLDVNDLKINRNL